MILIDRNKEQQEIVLTLSELTTLSSPNYLLVVKNDALRIVTNFYLPNNVSNHIDRYDLFVINTSTFSELSTGYYIYHVYETDNTGISSTDLIDENYIDGITTINLLECGKLFVKGEKNTVEVISPKRNNNYRVYDL